ncbi:hypothetical protein FA15DRAFT_706658 [Coprinopsis marcescibilis]|uniref:CFA20 domain-containing protein n=1 Tax=Coprinopsis marcescibilis TaxID=230819 RepID=A0A5C3KQQ9_COPMA|nr:hypothetical protein FA15DRAFT_706658 [Coprinopsis marcescibilis]
MFSSAVQPPIISLFSSTGSKPLGIWFSTTTGSNPHSFIHLLHDSTSHPPPAPPASLINPSSTSTENQGLLLDQTVLHIQSPDLRTTYIQCPPNADPEGDLGLQSVQGGRHQQQGDLGIRHQCIHLQVRNLSKDWSFEIGVRDTAGKAGILRFSTFQVHTIRSYTTSPRMKLRPSKQPILHLPLSFHAGESRTTPWSTINLHLPTYLGHFAAPEVQPERSEGSDSSGIPGGHLIPKAKYSHVCYVRIYANCRLRRVWLDDTLQAQQGLPWEFELYSPQ